MKAEKPFRHPQPELSRAIYTCDENGYINFYNEAAAALWGTKPAPEEVKWCGAWRLFDTSGQLISADTTSMAKTFHHRRPFQAQELAMLRPDGSYRIVKNFPSPLFNDFGQFTGIINIMIDVTDDVLDVPQKDWLYQAQTKDGIFLFDLKGKLRTVNPGGINMLGYERMAIKNLRLSDLSPFAYNYKEDSFLLLPNLHPLQHQQAFKSKDGRPLLLNVTVQHLPLGRLQAIVTSQHHPHPPSPFRHQPTLMGDHRNHQSA